MDDLTYREAWQVTVFSALTEGLRDAPSSSPNNTSFAWTTPNSVLVNIPFKINTTFCVTKKKRR